MRRERESTIYTVRASTRNSYYNSHTLLPHFISFNSLMFSHFCGHVIPANGGTRMQLDEALFCPNCPVIHCEHCQQLIPSTTITPHQPTSHIPVNQQLRYTHASSYTPASGSDATRSSIATNRTDSFANFKSCQLPEGPSHCPERQTVIKHYDQLWTAFSLGLTAIQLNTTEEPQNQSIRENDPSSR